MNSDTGYSQRLFGWSDHPWDVYAWVFISDNSVCKLEIKLNYSTQSFILTRLVLTIWLKLSIS